MEIRKESHLRCNFLYSSVSKPNLLMGLHFHATGKKKKLFIHLYIKKQKTVFQFSSVSLVLLVLGSSPLSGVSLSNRREAALPMSICCVPEPHLGPACEHLSFSLFHLQCLSAGCSLIPVNISGPPTTDDLVLPWPS